MKQATTQIRVNTGGPGLTEITSQVQQWVNDQHFTEGLLTVFITHTSASLTIQENADPDVRVDMKNFFAKLVPHSTSAYIHSAEGPDDMPAHIKTALTNVQLSIPLINRRLALGTWQGIYVFEHRDRPHTRKIALHLIGE
ncbi:MAG: YjbQ family protein [Deltaproteobacteria bacterium]|nr:YjbQ family protein [Deltaproteobacteria bacterium]MBN2674752.1 YjbQ family protein [Deltaproteobacteria bacterium]